MSTFLVIINIANKNVGIQIFELLFSLGMHLGVELLDQIVVLCLVFLRTIFHRGHTILYYYLQHTKVLFSLFPQPSISSFINFYYYSHPSRYGFLLCFDLHFLNA